MDIKDGDAKIRDLEHIVEEKEREIQMLRDSIHEYNNSNPVGEERILKLERDLKEIDGLVRGLTAEMLDLKACVQKLSKSFEDRPAVKGTEIVKSKNYPVVESPKIIAERKSVEKARYAPKEESEDVPSEEVLIIQPDGTMKRETKFGEDMIIADHRGGRLNGNTRRSGERDPLDRKPLIYADDDDTVEIKRKRK